MGLVFDPSSRSWNPCPPPTDLDYGYKSVVVVHNEHENPSTSRLVVFNYPRVPKAFNLATTQWENAFSAHTPIPVRNYDDEECDPTPTSVGFWVGMDNWKNRLRAVIDRCDRFIAHGDQLYDLKTLLDDSNEMTRKGFQPSQPCLHDQVKVKQKELKQTTSANGD
ncbi:hypothetical protein LguiB_001698 [Lonicera macranthoides]